MTRPELPDAVVERIRRERYDPRPTQPDYLHLAELRAALAGAFGRLPPAAGLALDLHCGTQPYRALVPARAVIGVDVTRHFGRADVVADLPLPFRDAAFALVVCTQALHLVRDPAATVAEVRRVLAPGGHAVVTVPHLLRREIPAERMWSAAEVRALFAGWDVEVRGVGGLGSAAVYLPASLAAGAVRRAPALRPGLAPRGRRRAPLGLALTAVGAALNAGLRPLARRWPACWIVTARRPAG